MPESPAHRSVPGATSRFVGAALDLVGHAAEQGWRGPDPYDGLWHPWPRPLTAGRRRRQVIVQLHVRSPVDIRRLYRRRHPRLAKALGLFGLAALRAHLLDGDARARALAVDALELLTTDRSGDERAWGYPFDVQTRWSFYAAGTPNVVVTSFAARALLAGAEPLERPDFSERARDAARWVLDSLWVEPEGYFAYHPGSRVNVHNANLLGASLVHRALGDEPLARERVTRAVGRTLAGQREDGSFPYGEGDNLGWADSFHTGFVLGCLQDVRTVDDRIDGALARGIPQYASYFDPDGRALLFVGRRYPEDAHSAGTGMSTLAALVAGGYGDEALLERVVQRTVTAMVHGRAAVPRRHRWGRARVWYPRWSDAHVALGLVDAATVLAGRSGAPAPRDDTHG